MVERTPFDPANPDHLTAIVQIWNAACGPDLAINQRFVRYNTQPTTGLSQAGQLALEHGRPVGVVVATAEPASGTAPGGWIDLIAVEPASRQRGIGSTLLHWAEHWLLAQGCTWVRLGGSIRTFVPGLPVELSNRAFFDQHGYSPRAAGETTWDVARRLRDYATPPSLANVQADVRPAEPGQEVAMFEFLEREFPGRWTFEVREFLREGGRLSDNLLLWVRGRVEGFCRVTFEDSVRPIERLYMHRLPHPWGHLGPIGVAQGVRGQHLGGALLDAGLRYLRDRGVDGCVIDWTTLLDFYAKFGFSPYRQYWMLAKAIGR